MQISDPPPPLVCSVLGESQGRSTLFGGRILSRDDVTGTYRIVIVKSGPSGRSSISQGGRFVATGGAEVRVGSATLSIEPGASYDVHMTVEAGGHTVTCTPLTGEKT